MEDPMHAARSSLIRWQAAVYVRTCCYYYRDIIVTVPATAFAAVAPPPIVAAVGVGAVLVLVLLAVQVAAAGRPFAGVHVVDVPMQLLVVLPGVVRRLAAADRLGHELPDPGRVVVLVILCQRLLEPVVLLLAPRHLFFSS